MFRLYYASNRQENISPHLLYHLIIVIQINFYFFFKNKPAIIFYTQPEILNATPLRTHSGYEKGKKMLNGTHTRDIPDYLRLGRAVSSEVVPAGRGQ